MQKMINDEGLFGVISLFYRIDDNSLESIAKHSSTFLGINERLQNEFQITGKGEYLNDKFNIILRGNVHTLKKAIIYILDSVGLPYKAHKPDFFSLFGKKETKQEFNEEKIGYTLFKKILKDRGINFRKYFLPPEEGCISYSYLKK